MDLQPKEDGQWSFKLGPVEKAIVVGAFSLCSYFGYQLLARLEKVSDIDTRTQVMAAKVDQITATVADLRAESPRSRTDPGAMMKMKHRLSRLVTEGPN